MRTQFWLAMSMVLFFVSACLYAVGGMPTVKSTMENWILYGQSPTWVWDGVLGSRG